MLCQRWKLFPRKLRNYSVTVDLEPPKNSPQKKVIPSWNQQNSTLTSSFCWWLDPRFVSKMPGSKWRSGTFPFLAQYRPMYFNLYKCTVTKSYDDPITGTDFWFWKEPAMCFVFLHPAFRLSRVPKKHLAGLPGLYLCLPTSGSNFKHPGHPHPCSSSSSSSSFRIIHDHSFTLLWTSQWWGPCVTNVMKRDHPER